MAKGDSDGYGRALSLVRLLCFFFLLKPRYQYISAWVLCE